MTVVKGIHIINILNIMWHFDGFFNYCKIVKAVQE